MEPLIQQIVLRDNKLTDEIRKEANELLRRIINDPHLLTFLYENLFNLLKKIYDNSNKNFYEVSNDYTSRFRYLPVEIYSIPDAETEELIQKIFRTIAEIKQKDEKNI